MSLNDHWMQRDLDVLWHPCTQMKDHERLPLVAIRKASGVWLEDFDGKRYLDAVSSWWVNVFGHANPRINARIRDQLDSLEHVMLAGFTHQPVIELSERVREVGAAFVPTAYRGILLATTAMVGASCGSTMRR